jgi:hypothetical protein
MHTSEAVVAHKCMYQVIFKLDFGVLEHNFHVSANMKMYPREIVEKIS